MKIAITGASGFIGKMLTKKHVSLGDEVHILTRKKNPNLEFLNEVIIHNGDLSNLNSLKGFIDDIDVLYHCAAETTDESKMHAINVLGTKNLLKVSAKELKHWVQLSSVGVYGPIHFGDVTENHLCNPINEYEKTKLESDLAVIEASESNTFTYTIIRPSNVFGTDMNNKSLFKLIKSIDKGFYFFIGEKGASANYIPVENVVQSLFLAATNTNAKNQVYNISNWVTMEDFIEIISKELGKQSPRLRFSINFIKILIYITSFIPKNPLTINRLNALSNRTIYVVSKIEKELNYKPIKIIDDSIKDLVDQYVKQSKS